MRPLLCLAVLLVLASPAARADDFSVRAGAYLDAEAAFVGGEYRFSISRDLRLAPNLEWVFPDNATYVAMSMDLQYDFRTKSSVQPWVGGGLGIYYVNPRGRKTATPTWARTSSQASASRPTSAPMFSSSWW